jgi:hypothetical protein
VNTLLSALILALALLVGTVMVDSAMEDLGTEAS